MHCLGGRLPRSVLPEILKRKKKKRDAATKSRAKRRPITDRVHKGAKIQTSTTVIKGDRRHLESTTAHTERHDAPRTTEDNGLKGNWRQKRLDQSNRLLLKEYRLLVHWSRESKKRSKGSGAERGEGVMSRGGRGGRTVWKEKKV